MTLGASSAGYLPLVTLSGRVGSDTPIVGEQSGLEAVIVENNVISGFTWNVYGRSLPMLLLLMLLLTCLSFVCR
jgi:hypothetical protein